VGDRLVLTKPIGTGIISTAIKHGVAPPAAEQAAVESMLRLNREAAEAMVEAPVHAATDITGFGLLGHLHSLARASGTAARVEAKAVPRLPGVLELADAGEVPGGTRSNERFLKDRVEWAPALGAPWRTALCDAQTSGGLLMALPAGEVERLLTELGRRGVAGRAIGELVAGSPGSIQVV
jgi:selenide,water dikinase